MYATQSDIEAVLAPALVAQLADEDGDEVADAAVIAQVVADADALIDSYCGGRYATPFEPVPEIVRRASAVLAAHGLMARRGFAKEEEPIVAQRTEIITWLRDVAGGRAHIPVSGQAPEPPQMGVSLVSRPAKFDDWSRY